MTTVQPGWNNPFKEHIDIIAQTEHYAVVHNPNADKFTEDSEYLMVFKDRGTIESRNSAYSITLAQMYDAENLYQTLAVLGSAVDAPASNEKLN